VILGSSGKTILGPLVPESGEEQIHRVQGFVLKPDTIKLGWSKETRSTSQLNIKDLHFDPVRTSIQRKPSEAISGLNLSFGLLKRNDFLN